MRNAATASAFPNQKMPKSTWSHWTPNRNQSTEASFDALDPIADQRGNGSSSRNTKGRAIPGRPSVPRVGIRPTSGAIAAGRPARWAHRCDARRTARGHRPQGPPVDLPRWLATRLDEGQARELVRARGVAVRPPVMVRVIRSSRPLLVASVCRQRLRVSIAQRLELLHEESCIRGLRVGLLEQALDRAPLCEDARQIRSHRRRLDRRQVGTSWRSQRFFGLAFLLLCHEKHRLRGDPHLARKGKEAWVAWLDVPLQSFTGADLAYREK